MYQGQGHCRLCSYTPIQSCSWSLSHPHQRGFHLCIRGIHSNCQPLKPSGIVRVKLELLPCMTSLLLLLKRLSIHRYRLCFRHLRLQFLLIYSRFHILQDIHQHNQSRSQEDTQNTGCLLLRGRKSNVDSNMQYRQSQIHLSRMWTSIGQWRMVSGCMLLHSKQCILPPELSQRTHNLFLASRIHSYL